MATDPTQTTDRLIRAALLLRQELRFVEIDGGLNCLIEFEDALDQHPNSLRIASEIKRDMVRAINNV